MSHIMSPRAEQNDDAGSDRSWESWFGLSFGCESFIVEARYPDD